MNLETLMAQYEAKQVIGRSEFCPREGVYKFLSFYDDTCLDKPALMAKVQWKPKISDNYPQNVTFIIQVESLRKTLDKKHFFSNTNDLIGKEIIVSAASYVPQVKVFAITWTVVASNQDDLVKQLNSALLKNPAQIDLNGLDDFDLDDNESSNELDFDGGY